MQHIGFEKFINNGFGWFCKSCMSSSENDVDANIPSRIFLEGEADKSAGLRRRGRAVWKNKEDGILSCPDCDASEVGEYKND
jgi:hypothetical protein